MANKDLEQRRKRFIDGVQELAEAHTGIKPQREQVEKHIGKWPGEYKPGAPSWMRPGPSDREVQSN